VLILREGILKTDARIEDDSMPQRNCEAKDEMNLAEFPLCALAHRLKPEVKTLRFEDRTWDKGRNKWITRQLTVTGSDAYGLPTEKDDEVLLGLIQLTRLHGFEERKVLFTRHELIRLLGWRDDSKSYARVEESLNRWTGVTLYYDNAWWNKQRKCWMNEKFHILDNVWLCHRGEPAPDTGLPIRGSPMSAFVWNEVVFRSFTHGNLKSIDFEFFQSLKSAVAKRLYRFLDKRFWHCERREFDLRELCCEHIGLSRNYDAANLKRKLLPGVRELEARGFLRTAAPHERFMKVRRGRWNVAFEREPAIRELPQCASEPDSPAQALVERGITPAVAVRTAETFDRDRVRQHIEVFDWLLRKADRRVSRNPAGFLLRSIEKNYSIPKEFRAREDRHSVQPTPARAVKEVPAETDSESRLSEREVAIACFWGALSAEEKAKTEAEALSQATELERNLIERGGAFAVHARKAVLNGYALRKIQRAQ
jgi:hypothetical protein